MWDTCSRTIAPAREFQVGKFGALNFGRAIHVQQIHEHFDTALCDCRPIHETEAVRPGDRFCSSCFDGELAASLGVDMYELGELTAVVADALEDVEKIAPDEDDTYDAYLAGDVWQTIRRLALEHYGQSCVLCGSTARLNVHHRRYTARGREQLADLIVLCADCHARHHGKVA